MIRLVLYVAFTLACSCVANAAEPRANGKREFPAKLQVISSTLSDDGLQELQLEIVPEKDVEIYAEYDVRGRVTGRPIAKVSIMTADGTPVETVVHYSQPNVAEEIEGVGIFHSYSGKLKITAQFKPVAEGEHLKIQCRLAGMNRRKSCCLGMKRIEAEFTNKPKQ